MTSGQSWTIATRTHDRSKKWTGCDIVQNADDKDIHNVTNFPAGLFRRQQDF